MSKAWEWDLPTWVSANSIVHNNWMYLKFRISIELSVNQDKNKHVLFVLLLYIALESFLNTCFMRQIHGSYSIVYYVLHQLTWFWSASLQICFQHYIIFISVLKASRLTWRWQCLQILLPECGQRPQEVALILRWGSQNESKDRQWHLPKLDPTI